MEDFNTSQNLSYNHTNITSDVEQEKKNVIEEVVICVITSISLPVTLVAIFALFLQVRRDHVAPIYVINLLIADVIQHCGLIMSVRLHSNMILRKVGENVFDLTLTVSVCFMVCVAMERYLIIAHPLWYRFRRNIKISVAICVAVWVLPPVLHLTLSLVVSDELALAVYGYFLLLPFPLFIYFLCGTLTALCASHVPSDEKRRIVGALVLVLLIYTTLFLPTVIWFLAEGGRRSILSKVAFLLLQLSPLADSLLYVFMRKGTIDKLLASVCHCRMDNSDISRTDNEVSTSPV